MDSITAKHFDRRFSALTQMMQARADRLDASSRKLWASLYVGQRSGEQHRPYVVTDITAAGCTVRFDDGEVRTVANPHASTVA